MSKSNKNFGYSLGPYTKIEPIVIPIDLGIAGINVEDAPNMLQDAEAVSTDRIRLVRGGISPEFAFSALPFGGVGGLKAVLQITGFKVGITKIVVRMFEDHWEWFNGANWIAVGGSIAGIANQRLYNTVMDGKLIAAYGSTRLKSWDGNPLNSVVDLSAEAPKALYVTKLGNRVIAANSSMVFLNDLDPNFVCWSADGDMLEWTDVSAGAGGLVVKPEGTYTVANDITGMSNLERGTVLYRERSIVLISRTGVRAAPFRFATIDFAHGTESPYSIANGGVAIGDFFLGYDFVVYHFDGEQPPVPVGLPIQRRLQERISDLSECVGFINPVEMEYHLLSPTAGVNRPLLTDEHVFSIKDYKRKQKLIWRYRALSQPISTGAYVPSVTSNTSPFVDSFTREPEDRVDPTNPPLFVVSAVGADAPVAPSGRTPFGLWGLDKAKWGTSPAPDTVFSDRNGTNYVIAGGYCDDAHAVGAKMLTRISASNSLNMVNFPTDRRFSPAKHKQFTTDFAAAVRAVVGGESKLRLSVQRQEYLGVIGFDDFLFGGTTQNAYLNALTFEEIEECCAHHKSFFPWLPIGGRGNTEILRDIAAKATVAGNPFSNAPRVNGIRQYQYLDFAMAQYRYRGRTYSAAGAVTKEGIDGSPVAYVAKHKVAAAACGLGIIIGLNSTDQGSGTDPDWGIFRPGAPTLAAASPREFDEIIDASFDEPAVHSWWGWAWYPDNGVYHSKPEIQASLLTGYNRALGRNPGLISISGRLTPA